MRRLRWLATVGLSLILSCGLSRVVNENGLSQVKKPVNVQQLAQKKQLNKKAIIDAGQNQVPVVVTPTPAAMATPLSFTLKPDKTTAYQQGELVKFTISPPPPQGYPYVFVLHFDDDQKDAAIDYSPDRPSTYRFLTAGQHTVFVSPKRQPQPYGTNIYLPAEPTVSNAVIEVEKTQLTVRPRRGESGPPFVINQELSFSTYDLPDVKYQYIFDEETPEEGGPTITHHFNSPGKHTVSVVLFFTTNDIDQTIKSDPKDVMIDLLPSDAVRFSANPPQQVVHQPINFTAVLDSNRLNSLHLNNQKLQYQFTFGDGGIRNWDQSPHAAHTYVQAGNYNPYVEIRLDDGHAGTLLVTSAVFPVTISAARFVIDPKILLIVVVIVVIGGTLLLYFSTKLLRKPADTDQPTPNQPSTDTPVNTHPTFVFHTDENSPRLKQPRVSVGLQVRFNSGTGRSEGKLIPSQAGLIRSVRRRNG